MSKEIKLEILDTKSGTLISKKIILRKPDWNSDVPNDEIIKSVNELVIELTSLK
jgi:hypothetical protein